VSNSMVGPAQDRLASSSSSTAAHVMFAAACERGCEVGGVTGFGVENLAKKDKIGQPRIHNSEGEKIGNLPR
jgi:hypothetical protein